MEDNNFFNREAFAMLLRHAKGNKSLTKFAEETGVSTAHLSRLIRGILPSPPSPELISKIAAKADNGVTFEQLMQAAGHIGGNHTTDPIESRLILRDELRQIETKFFNAIMAYLNESDFFWNISKPERRSFYSDMEIHISKEQKEHWHLHFRPTHQERTLISKHIIFSLYGYLTTIHPNSTDKYCIVVNSTKFYDKLLTQEELNLNANLFIMLVDLDEIRILEVKQIAYFNDRL